jgi:L,D-peptidoglycan transpeptidase YkuD (ErfK/YbiS/YcfS/YnhG family)
MSGAASMHHVRVTSLSRAATRGWVSLGNLRYACALGRSGLRVLKREGDGGTPVGRWALRKVYYRADRLSRPRVRLPVVCIRPPDGWCDAVGDCNYNRPVRRPYRASYEAMWRDDALYDLVVVLGHNDRPRVQGKGSAVFMHVARPDYAPTAGCVAMRRGDLLRLLSVLGRRSALLIGS